MRILLSIFLLFTAQFSLIAAGNLSELNPKANLYVKNSFQGESLNLEGPDSSIICKTLVANTLQANVVETQSLELDQISANSIVSPNGEPIIFLGHVKIQGQISWNQGASTSAAGGNSAQSGKKRKLESSFMVVDELILAGARQWKAIDHESFNGLSDKMLFSSTKEVNGWTVRKTQPASLFLKTASVKLNEANPQNEITEKMMAGSYGEEIAKTFKGLPGHEDVMIEAQFHFLSPFWRGQAAYLKVDGQYVWIDHHDWTEYEVADACEFDENNLEDYKVSVPVNVVLKHSSEELKIEIGITKTEDELSECANEINRNENLLFAIDDFVLSVK